MTLRDVQNRRHLARHASVMHRHDGLRSGRDQGLKPGFVKIERVRPDIGKDRPGAAEHEGVGHGHEREGRTITSSPGDTSNSIPAISSAWVHDVVSITLPAPSNAFEHVLTQCGVFPIAAQPGGQPWRRPDTPVPGRRTRVCSAVSVGG
jgi:hypothetical protein